MKIYSQWHPDKGWFTFVPFSIVVTPSFFAVCVLGFLFEWRRRKADGVIRAEDAQYL